MEESPGIQANVLVTERDWPVGWAILRSDPRMLVPSQEKVRPVTLDLYAHPNFQAECSRLLASVDLPADRKIIAPIDSQDAARQAALAAAGFVVEGRLTRLYQWAGQPVDLVLMTR